MHKFKKYLIVLYLDAKFYINGTKMLQKYTLNLCFKKKSLKYYEFSYQKAYQNL